MRLLVRFWGLGSIVVLALLIAPGSALACSPTDPQGPPPGDACSQSFTTALPTAAGQTVTDYAIEYIPKDAINVKYTLKFRDQPSSVTIAPDFNQNATDMNPDMTLPKPGPGEQAARVVWTATATGPGAPATTRVTYTVTFEEPAKPVQVDFLAKKGHRELKEVTVEQEFDFVVRVHNPNDDSVTGTLKVNPGGLFFHVGGIEYGSHFHTCSHSLYLRNCPFALPAGGSGSITVFGYYRNTTVKHPRPDVQAIGQQDPDGQSVTSAQIDLPLRVLK